MINSAVHGRSSNPVCGAIRPAYWDHERNVADANGVEAVVVGHVGHHIRPRRIWTGTELRTCVQLSRTFGTHSRCQMTYQPWHTGWNKDQEIGPYQVHASRCAEARY